MTFSLLIISSASAQHGMPAPFAYHCQLAAQHLSPIILFFFSILRVRTNVATAAGLARVAITYSIQPREWCPLSGD